jgi:hypothetical protein
MILLKITIVYIQSENSIIAKWQSSMLTKDKGKEEYSKGRTSCSLYNGWKVHLKMEIL